MWCPFLICNELAFILEKKREKVGEERARARLMILIAGVNSLGLDKQIKRSISLQATFAPAGGRRKDFSAAAAGEMFFCSRPHYTQSA